MLLDVTKTQLDEILSYDPFSGTISWKTYKPRQRATIDNIAGCIDRLGYRVIRINGKNYFAHRIAWCMFYGELAKCFIDHINGNRSDNRICNLRECNPSQNGYNSKLPSNNHTGIRGVKMKKINGDIRYYVDISFLGSCKRFGTFNSPVSASIVARSVFRVAAGSFFCDRCQIDAIMLKYATTRILHGVESK